MIARIDPSFVLFDGECEPEEVSTTTEGREEFEWRASYTSKLLVMNYLKIMKWGKLINTLSYSFTYLFKCKCIHFINWSVT